MRRRGVGGGEDERRSGKEERRKGGEEKRRVRGESEGSWF